MEREAGDDDCNDTCGKDITGDRQALSIKHQRACIPQEAFSSNLDGYGQESQGKLHF
jgi:hypothetical protein